MQDLQVRELLLQSLEHERGGVKVYRSALKCAINDDLRKEWSEYLEQTEGHVATLERVCTAFGLDPHAMTPGCKILRDMGASLVRAMEQALAAGNPAAAEIVACECVVLAETKDHQDWELLGEVARNTEGEAGQVLKDAYAQIEDQEDEHLYHTKGWCRELWLQSLGLKAELPPPEEERHVKSAMEAAVVAKDRKKRGESRSRKN